MFILAKLNNRSIVPYLRRVIIDAYKSENRKFEYDSKNVDELIRIEPFKFDTSFVEISFTSSYSRVNRRVKYRIKNNIYKYDAYMTLKYRSCLETRDGLIKKGIDVSNLEISDFDCHTLTMCDGIKKIEKGDDPEAWHD